MLKATQGIEECKGNFWPNTNRTRVYQGLSACKASISRAPIGSKIKQHWDEDRHTCQNRQKNNCMLEIGESLVLVHT